MNWSTIAMYWMGSIAVFGFAATAWFVVGSIRGVDELKLRRQLDTATLVFFCLWGAPLVLPVVLASKLVEWVGGFFGRLFGTR